MKICKLLITTACSFGFEYIIKWIAEYLTNEYWTNLSFSKQKELYLNSEKLFQGNHHDPKIVEFMVKIHLSSKMMKFWLQNEVDSKDEMTVILMARIQCIISKINNKTINNHKHINNTLIPSIMSLLKHSNH